MFYKGLSALPSKRDAVFICLVLSVQMYVCVCWCGRSLICVCFLESMHGLFLLCACISSRAAEFNAAPLVTAEFK